MYITFIWSFASRQGSMYDCQILPVIDEVNTNSPFLETSTHSKSAYLSHRNHSRSVVSIERKENLLRISQINKCSFAQTTTTKKHTRFVDKILNNTKQFEEMLVYIIELWIIHIPAIYTSFLYSSGFFHRKNICSNEYIIAFLSTNEFHIHLLVSIYKHILCLFKSRNKMKRTKNW